MISRFTLERISIHTAFIVLKKHFSPLNGMPGWQKTKTERPESCYISILFFNAREEMGQKTVFYGLSLLLCFYCIGCKEGFLDPKQVGRFDPVPVENVILDTLGVVDEPLNTYANAREPFPEDVIPVDQDYVFGSGDAIRISIYELREEGRAFLDEYIVSETGKISIPIVGVLYAMGLTEIELENEIKDRLMPDILVSPSVKVMLFRSESQLFSIEGEGVNRASRYGIPRHDFRLLDALALAGGIAQFNVSHVYITRKITGKEGLAGNELDSDKDFPEKSATPKPAEFKRLDEDNEDDVFKLIAPSYSMGFTGKSGMISTSEMITDDELEVLAAPEGIDYKRKSSRISSGKKNAGQAEWVFENGKYIPIPVEESKVDGDTIDFNIDTKPVASTTDKKTSSGWNKVGAGGSQSRVIKIPVDKLFGGDSQYNIIIRPGDVVRVPVDVVGEFYVMGNVNTQSVFSLNGRRMTLVQAITVANGLGDLAWPTRVEVTRRIGRNKQVTVMVNLKKIAAGHQPDFFIKPDDTINVGTDATAIFLYKLRNAFKASYGFGFEYSRNFQYLSGSNEIDYSGSRY